MKVSMEESPPDALPEKSPMRSIQQHAPLVVDLDGTLVKTDLLIESVLALLRKQPLYVFFFPLWIMRGKARFKEQVASRISLNPNTLPWRTGLIDDLRRQRTDGRSLVLATGSDMRIAQAVAEHLELFDTVLASDGRINLCGELKRDLLVSRFGEEGFDYAASGDDKRDLAVWASARTAILVGPEGDAKRGLAACLKALRPAHWLKNFLVFVPLIAAYRLYDVALAEKCLLAFVAFGCCASSGYLFNDLIDLEADRHHPQKRFRAFAAGDLPLVYAMIASPVLLIVGCLLGALVSPLVSAILLLYFGMTAGYSLHIKKIAVLDVLFLAGLYTLRIMVGSAATGIWPSHWLLAFSIFLFFSLALVKRYGELVIMRQVDGNGARARGYELGDAELLAAMGIASGYLAVLVLALHLAAVNVLAFRATGELLWFLCPLLLYWISYVWLTAHRGKMPVDPVVFATRDRTSAILILLMVATVVVAL
jgi:4-hydroxybenzoate polyprenyltransferase